MFKQNETVVELQNGVGQEGLTAEAVQNRLQTSDHPVDDLDFFPGKKLIMLFFNPAADHGINPLGQDNAADLLGRRLGQDQSFLLQNPAPFIQSGDDHLQGAVKPGRDIVVPD